MRLQSQLTNKVMSKPVWSLVKQFNLFGTFKINNKTKKTKVCFLMLCSGLQHTAVSRDFLLLAKPLMLGIKQHCQM